MSRSDQRIMQVGRRRTVGQKSNRSWMYAAIHNQLSFLSVDLQSLQYVAKGRLAESGSMALRHWQHRRGRRSSRGRDGSGQKVGRGLSSVMALRGLSEKTLLRKFVCKTTTGWLRRPSANVRDGVRERHLRFGERSIISYASLGKGSFCEFKPWFLLQLCSRESSRRCSRKEFAHSARMRGFWNNTLMANSVFVHKTYGDLQGRSCLGSITHAPRPRSGMTTAGL